MIRIMKPSSEISGMLKERGKQQNYKANAYVKKKKNLNLGYPTWLSFSNWAVKIVVPFTRDYQKVILHALVGFEET